MNTLYKTAILSALALVVATPTFAGDHKDKKHHDRDPAKMVEKLDTDKNGTLSKVEFMAKPEQMFEKMDSDKNGELTVEEFKKAHEKMKEMRKAKREKPLNE